MLKFKPPLCFNMEDAKFVVDTIDKLLTGSTDQNCLRGLLLDCLKVNAELLSLLFRSAKTEPRL